MASKKKTPSNAEASKPAEERKCFSPNACIETTPGHVCAIRRVPSVDKSDAAKTLRK